MTDRRMTGDVVSDVRALCERAMQLADGDTAVRLEQLRARLDGPLRIAIAGRIKAGKSTLLNALVGERLAATDAGECTRVITVFHHAERYELRAHTVDGGVRELTFRRIDGRLHYDLGGLEPEQVAHLEVGWPAPVLRRVTLIDTPGLGSIDDENSRRTTDFLHHDPEQASGADAVVYLMRHLHRSDAEFLGSFMDRSVAGASPVNAVAVLSRADEIGAARPDAMASAARIAARYGADPSVRTLVAQVLPLAGLIAETGLTLAEHEFAALRRVAELDPDERRRVVRSVDDWCEPSATALTVEVRRELLDRFGLFGLRIAVAALAEGVVGSSTDLSRHLVACSGLGELRRVIDEVFLPRAGLLQARTALVALRGLVAEVAAADPAGAGVLRRDLDELEAGTLEFARLQAAHAVMTGSARVPAAERDEIERLLTAGDPVGAIGLDRLDADQRQAYVLAGIERWRTRAADPLADPATTSVADTLARLHERWWTA
jgi:hypothetical protein